MNESPFRLTAHDIRGQEFGRAVRGYDRAEVDEFKERVAEEVERLSRERVQHEERLRSAAEQLRTFQERERALNDALVAAQQLGTELRQQAEREAEMILREARAEAAQLLERGQHEERLVRERATLASRQFSAYLVSLRNLLERQLAEIEELHRQARQAPVEPDEAEAPATG